MVHLPARDVWLRLCGVCWTGLWYKSELRSSVDQVGLIYCCKSFAGGGGL